MPTRRANAVWEGGLKGGKGSFQGESGAIGGSYSFGTRFGEEAGTNPEELLAAAEAACFSMALSGGLEKDGTPATRIETNAACTVAPQKEGGFRLTTMHLTVKATVPGIANDAFQQKVQGTKSGCPVSKALAGVEITVEAELQ